MPAVRPPFDDRSDVAAVVYGRAEDPDTLLAGFLRDAHAQGFDAVGVVQARHDPTLNRPAAVDFQMFPDESTVGAPADGCGRALLGVGQRLARLVEQRPDIVVLNRFGWQELNGAGLLDVLQLAILREVPAVIAVPEALFPHWLDLANGLTVRLACDRGALDRWWRSLWRAPPLARRRSTTCERYK